MKFGIESLTVSLFRCPTPSRSASAPASRCAWWQATTLTRLGPSPSSAASSTQEKISSASMARSSTGGSATRKERCGTQLPRQSSRVEPWPGEEEEGRVSKPTSQTLVLSFLFCWRSGGAGAYRQGLAQAAGAGQILPHGQTHARQRWSARQRRQNQSDGLYRSRNGSG